MKRIAFVVPRYGAEIGGGAEEECRRLAELLAADLDVTVLTSCALDYRCDYMAIGAIPSTNGSVLTTNGFSNNGEYIAFESGAVGTLAADS